MKRKIIFVCHGNICRSVMAEYMFKHLLKQENNNEFEVYSRAVSKEELGNDVYPPCQEALIGHHIPFLKHHAEQIDRIDFLNAFLIITMDDSNVYYLHQLFPNDNFSHVHKLMEFTNSSRDVLDPWYTREFETCYQDLEIGLKALFNYLKTQ